MARFLLCDDDASYRALLRVVLDDGGDDEIVGEARDGRECIDLARELRPDVILLDLNMPRMSGVEALPILRELVPETKIVALTTARALDNEQEFVDLGGVAFIEKPHEILALRPALRRVLDAAAEPRLDLVAEMFRLWWAGDRERERAFDYFAEDVEYLPLDSPEPVHGVAAVRALVDNAPEELKRATVEADRLLLAGDNVVLLATAAVPRRTSGGQDYTERFPVAWVFGVRDGKVASVRSFSTWEDAKEAAGISGQTGAHLERKLARSAWRWMQRAPGRLILMRRLDPGLLGG